jgi:hypothetical protein
MSLSRRQQRLLTGIDDAVSRSDPRMASLPAVFGSITADQPMPRREELRGPVSPIRGGTCGVTPTSAAGTRTAALMASRSRPGCERQGGHHANQAL